MAHPVRTSFLSSSTFSLLIAASLLRFDEVQLLDVTSASIFRDVLIHYWLLGGVVLGTSNRVPSDLFTQGVQRRRIEGFLQALQRRCEVVMVDCGTDWRYDEGQGAEGEGKGGRWFCEEGDGRAEVEWSATWDRLVAVRAGESLIQITFDGELIV